MIYKTYFIVTQIIVLIAYLVFRNENWQSDKYSFFYNKYCYSISITSSIFVGINYNLEYQIFCNPVSWTYWILIPTGIWLVLYPHIKDIPILKSINSLLTGVAVFVLIYIILFGSVEYLIFLIISLIIGLPLYFGTKKLRKIVDGNYFDFINYYILCISLPYVLLYLLITNFLLETHQIHKRIFIGTIAILIGISVYSTIKINDINNKLCNYETNKDELLALKNNKIDNYYLELLLGTHWKYHTKICLYDGWRPPYHDPFIPIARWFGGVQILNATFDSLEERKQVYSEIYGSEAMQLNCKCATNERWPEDF